MQASTSVWFALLASTACSPGTKAADPVGADAAPAAGRTESDSPASEVRPVSWTFLEHRDGALVTAASAGADTATIQRRFAALDVACGQDFPEGWSLRVEFVEGRTHAFSTTVPAARLTGCLADRLARVRLPSGRSGVMDATLGSPPSARADLESLVPFQEAAVERCNVYGSFVRGEEHVVEACLKEGRREVKGRAQPILKVTTVRFYNRSSGPLAWTWRDNVSGFLHEHPCESKERSSYGINHEHLSLDLPGGAKVPVYPAVRYAFSPRDTSPGPGASVGCAVVEREVKVGEVAVEHDAACSCRALQHGYTCQPASTGG